MRDPLIRKFAFASGSGTSWVFGGTPRRPSQADACAGRFKVPSPAIPGTLSDPLAIVSRGTRKRGGAGGPGRAGRPLDLLKDERELVAGKQGPTRLGFALLLKFYTRAGRFPRGRAELDDDAVAFVARQVGARVRPRLLRMVRPHVQIPPGTGPPPPGVRLDTDNGTASGVKGLRTGALTPLAVRMWVAPEGAGIL
jgi:hypothetical protein